MTQWLRQMILLLAGAAALELLLPRGGMHRVSRLALGIALIAEAAAALMAWPLPEMQPEETARLWSSGRPYEAAVYEQQAIRAWKALEDGGNER